jgi:hypothetical protein
MTGNSHPGGSDALDKFEDGLAQAKETGALGSGTSPYLTKDGLNTKMGPNTTEFLAEPLGTVAGSREAILLPNPKEMCDGLTENVGDGPFSKSVP